MPLQFPCTNPQCRHLITCAEPPAEGEVPCPKCGTVVKVPQSDEQGKKWSPSPALERSTLPKIGRYQLQAKLGAGGMGTVYKAHDTLLNRTVAIKVLSPQVSQNKKYVDRFFREARSAAALDHPNIVRAIDIGQEGQHYYFVMEFIEGITVLRHVRFQKPFIETEAVNIAIQICQALQHAATKNIIHRDIKPDNIMLGPTGQAVLTDLGLAKAMDEGSTTITQAGQTLLSPSYASPEQIRGDPVIDGRTDIYSLGMTLYHMVAGVPAFDGPTAAVITAKHLHEPFPDPKVACPQLSTGFCKVLQMMTEKDPEDRYQSPEELLEDLMLVQQGRPPDHAGPPLPELGKKTAKGKRRKYRSARRSRSTGPILAAAGAVLGLAVVAGIFFYSQGSSSSPQQPGPTSSSSSFRSPPPSRPPQALPVEDPESKEYSSAAERSQKAANNPQARMGIWKKFLEEYPKGTHAEEARGHYQQSVAEDSRIRYLNLADLYEERLAERQIEKAASKLEEMETLVKESAEAGCPFEIPADMALDGFRERLEDERKAEQGGAAYRLTQAKAASESDPKARIALWIEFQKEFPGAEAAEIQRQLETERQALLKDCQARYNALVESFEADLERGLFDKAEAALERLQKLTVEMSEADITLTLQLPEDRKLEALSQRYKQKTERHALRKDFLARYTRIIIALRTALKENQLSKAEAELKNAENLLAEANQVGAALSLAAEDQPEVLGKQLKQQGERQVLYKELQSRYQAKVARLQDQVARGDLKAAETELKNAENVMQKAVEAGFELEVSADSRLDALRKRLKEENDRRAALESVRSSYNRLVSTFDARLAESQADAAEDVLKDIESFIEQQQAAAPLEIPADQMPESLRQRLSAARAAIEEKTFADAQVQASQASDYSAGAAAWDAFLKAYPKSKHAEAAHLARYRKHVEAFEACLREARFKDAESGLETLQARLQEAEKAGVQLSLSEEDGRPTSLKKRLSSSQAAYAETQAFQEAKTRASKSASPQEAISDWERFLETYPEGKHAGEARKGIKDAYPRFYRKHVEIYYNCLKNNNFREAEDQRQAAEDFIRKAVEAGFPMDLPPEEKPDGLLKRMEARKEAYEREQIPGRIVKTGLFELPAEDKDSRGNPIQKGVDERTGYPREIRHKATGWHFIFVPSGTFLMGRGNSEKELLKVDEETHSVTLTRFFYLGKYEISMADLKAFEQATGYLTAKVTALQKQADEAAAQLGLGKSAVKSWKNTGFSQTDAHPAVHVNWNDVQQFLAWANRDSKRPMFRLPTEAEWECACRAGSTSRYFWGDDEAAAARHAIINKVDGPQTSPVGSKRPNGWGLYDMLGNVREWCEDWYDDSYYRTGPGADPVNREKGKQRVWRGGAWLDLAKEARCAARGKNKPEYEDNGLGFRVALVTPPLPP